MARDVIITPASGLIDFQGSVGVSSATIELDSSGNLNIANPGGDLTLGDTSRDLYIGNGVANVDIIFEQDGEIRGLTGKTLTFGQSDSYISFAGDITSGLNVSGIVTALSFSGNASSATYATYAGIATYATTAGVSTNVSGGTASVTQLNVSGVSTFQGNVYLGDNDRLYFGDSIDSSIHHDGNNLFLLEGSGTGNLYIKGNALQLQSPSNENYLIAYQNGAVEIYYDNSKKFETTGIGVSIVNGTSDTATIAGPAELIIDPAAVGDNTGLVRIKGDLYVDGTQFVVNSTTIELADFNVGIATTVGTNLLLDGAGIGIGSTNIRKTITWNNTASALTSSEDWNLVSGKQYEINGTSVLSSTTLGSGVVNSSLTSVGTLGQLNVSGITTSSRLTLNGANNTATGGGQIYLNGATGNRIDFNTSGVAAPSFTTRSAGTKIVLYPNISGSDVDYAFGIETGGLWYSIANTPSFYRWYAGTTQLADLKGTGQLVLGTTSLTGTASQKLQVTGGAYVSGNLGIGATNPQFKLSVNGLSAISNDQSQLLLHQATNTPTVIHRNDGSIYYILLSNASDTPSEIWNGLRPLRIDLTTGRIQSDNGQFFQGNTLIGSGTETGTASQRLQVTGGAYVSGNLGVGRTNPSALLHLTGGSAIGIIVERNSAEESLIRYQNNSGSMFAGLSDNADYWAIDTDTNLATSPVFVARRTTGNIGIGQTNPAYPLDVTGSIRTTGSLFIDFGIYHDGDTNTSIQFPSNDNIRFNTNGLERVRISSDGSFGIGTDLPTSLLDVRGTVSIGTTIDIVPYDNLGTLSFEGSAGQLFSITNNLTSGSIFSVNDVSGIPSIDVDADGTIQLAPYGSTENVGIGTTNPTSKLDVVGDIKTTGDVSANSITATSASFSGNVSIAGTLTYEDVTNVDSLGIITARTGIQVLAGGINVSGVSTFQGNVYLGDNDKLILGDGGDLEIYHDGNNSVIRELGTGLLSIQSSGVNFLKYGTSEYFAQFATDGSVSLYYDNSKKFETTGYGATVYGTLQSQQANVSGIVTASAFYGDGANVTGISTLNIIDYGVGLGGGGGSQVSVSTVAPSSPTEGDLWYNSNLGRTFVYYDDEDSSQWVDAAPFNITQDEPTIQPGKTSTSFVAIEGQTTFNVSHTIGYVDVFMNGVRLNYSEFAEDGSSITIIEPASSGDVLDVVEYRMGIGDTGPQGPAAALTIGTRVGAFTQNIAEAGITILLRSGIGTANF